MSGWLQSGPFHPLVGPSVQPSRRGHLLEDQRLAPIKPLRPCWTTVPLERDLRNRQIHGDIESQFTFRRARNMNREEPRFALVENRAVLSHRPAKDKLTRTETVLSPLGIVFSPENPPAIMSGIESFKLQSRSLPQPARQAEVNCVILRMCGCTRPAPALHDLTDRVLSLFDVREQVPLAVSRYHNALSTGPEALLLQLPGLIDASLHDTRYECNTAKQ